MGPSPLRLALVPAFAWAAFLAAQGPVQVASVIRKGLPPYTPGGQTYVLDGGRDRGLSPGTLLRVRRSGDPRSLGWLRVTLAGPVQAEAQQVQEGATYILKGDRAERVPLPALPPTPGVQAPPPALPGAPLPRPEAPPWEGLLYFLPGHDDLSPEGHRKLAGWVASWGPGGRWTLQVPAARAPLDLQRRRTETLRVTLQALGVAQVTLEDQPRTAPGPYDPAWVRCQD